MKLQTDAPWYELQRSEQGFRSCRKSPPPLWGREGPVREEREGQSEWRGERRVRGGVCEKMDADGWMQGWMDGWMDGCIEGGRGEAREGGREGDGVDRQTESKRDRNKDTWAGEDRVPETAAAAGGGRGQQMKEEWRGDSVKGELASRGEVSGRR